VAGRIPGAVKVGTRPLNWSPASPGCWASVLTVRHRPRAGAGPWRRWGHSV